MSSSLLWNFFISLSLGRIRVFLVEGTKSAECLLNYVEAVASLIVTYFLILFESSASADSSSKLLRFIESFISAPIVSLRRSSAESMLSSTGGDLYSSYLRVGVLVVGLKTCCPLKAT